MALAPGQNTSIPATTPSTSIFTTLPTDTTSSPPGATTSSPLTTSLSPTTTTPSPLSSTSPPPVSSITSATPTVHTSVTPVTSFITKTRGDGTPETTTIVQTSVQAITETPTANAASTATGAAAAASSSVAAGLASSDDGTSDGGGLQKGPKIAIAVVIPIVVVSLLVLAGLWFWRKRKARKDAEELRRKEMEEYGLNPNHDPTLPAVAGGGSTNGDEASTMRERDAGYRGWGTTSSNTRKASTTLSSNPGMARSDSGGNGYKGQHSPTGNMTQVSDPQSGDPLMEGHREEGVGALGAAPAASGNRGNGMNRGPSNASSAYSGANRSDVSALSGDGPLPNGSPPYAQDYMYPDEPHQNGWGDGQPVIRDVSARRNTRIENPSIVPQQGNAGISQNF